MCAQTCPACVSPLFVIGEVTVNTWFLRKPDGEIFGPVEQSELLRWAGADRIGPEDAVSSDQVSWLPAPQMPGLKLWWMIEWPDGHSAGPYHVSSLAEMLADGELDGDETVRQVHTNQSASLLQTLQNALLSGEIHLNGGALTAAMCDMIRGQTTQLSVLPAPPPVVPVEGSILVAAQLDKDDVKDPVLEAAKRLHIEVSERAQAMEAVLRHAEGSLQYLKTRDLDARREADELEQMRTAQAVQELAVRETAEAAQRAQLLQNDLVGLRNQLAAQRREQGEERATARARGQRCEDELRQAAEQLVAMKAEHERSTAQLAEERRVIEAQLSATLKRIADQAAQQAAIIQQRDALQLERDAALARVAECEQTYAQFVESRQQNEVQLRAELQSAQAALGAAQGLGQVVRRELEAVNHSLAERENTLRQHEQNIERLQLQLADMETARATAETQVKRRELELSKVAANLEVERDAAQAQRNVLLLERDAALERAEERSRMGEQMAADKRCLEEEWRAQLNQAGAERDAAQRGWDEARKELEAGQRQSRATADRITTVQAAEADELMQQNAGLVAQLETACAVQKRLEAELQQMQQELAKRHEQARLLPAVAPLALPTPSSAPLREQGAASPRPTAFKTAPSSDVYCLPHRKAQA